jgi:hypothetical protein
MTTWSELRVGDEIICPVTGRIERVTMTGKRLHGRHFVRTTNHDHINQADGNANLVTTKDERR